MLFFCDKAEIIRWSIANAIIRKSATMSFRSIVLLFALLLCVVQITIARPSEGGTAALLTDNSLFQTLESGMDQLHKAVDDVKNNVRSKLFKGIHIEIAYFSLL